MARKILYPEKETYITNIAVDTNYVASASNTSLRFGTGIEDKKTRALLQFPTADFPADSSDLVYAKLKMFFDDYDLDTLPVERYCDVRYLTANWEEDEATWNNRITGAPWGSAGGDFSGAGTYDDIQIIFSRSYRYIVQVTLTNMVKDWIDAVYANYGIIIFFSIEDAPPATTQTIAKLKNRYADAPTLLEISYSGATTAAERHFRPKWISSNKWQMVTGQSNNTITMPRNPEDVRVIPVVDIGIQQTLGRGEKRVAKDVGVFERHLIRRTFILTFPPEGRKLLGEWNRLQAMGRVVTIYPTGFYDVRDVDKREKCWKDLDAGAGVYRYYLPHRRIRDDSAADEVRIWVDGVEKTTSITNINYKEGLVALNYDPGAEALVEALYQVQWVCIIRSLEPGIDPSYRMKSTDMRAAPVITLEEIE